MASRLFYPDLFTGRFLRKPQLTIENIMENTDKLAVLIDADNAQPGIVDGLLMHSIQPIQQFAYTKGKNATDSALTLVGHAGCR